jgi:hypothetical protein
MTYPNMDLQSLPAGIDLRVGTDQAERAIQLAYWQIWAGIQALKIIDTLGIYPEQVVNAGDESSFATSLDNLLLDLVAAMVHFDEIWAYVP